VGVLVKLLDMVCDVHAWSLSLVAGLMKKWVLLMYIYICIPPRYESKSSFFLVCG